MVEIVKIRTGDFQLNIKSASGNSLLKSVPFKSENEAKQILKQTISKPVFERKTNHQGQFVICLKTENGEQVGTSHTYSSEAGMENGIKNLMKSLTNYPT